MGSVQNNDYRAACYSNYSSGSNKYVDLSAPGGEFANGCSSGVTRAIYSTFAINPAFGFSSHYGYLLGTSMAAPQVAGVAALMKSYRPAIDGETMRNDLKNYSDPNQSGYLGVGRLNAAHPITRDFITRFQGSDADEMAINMSQARFPENGTASAIAIISDTIDDYAMTAGVFSGAKNSPMMVADSTTGLSAEALAEIDRVLDNPDKNIYLMGDTASIPASVVTQLSGAGYDDVFRYDGGGDPIGTGTQVADKIRPGDTTYAFMVYKDALDDAITTVPGAAYRSIPMLVNWRTLLDAQNEQWLNDHNIKRVFIVGGDSKISDETEAYINDVVGIKTTRLYGSDQYGTSKQVSNCLFSTTVHNPCYGKIGSRIKPESIGMANDTAYPESILGSAFMGYAQGPNVLTEVASTPYYSRSYITNVADVGQEGFLFGGTSLISSYAAGVFNSYIDKY